jgi:hypothetical protein
MSEMTCECGRPTSGAWLCEDCSTTFAYAIVNTAAYFDDLGTVERKQARFTSSGNPQGSIGKAQPLIVDLRFVNGGAAPDDDKSGRPRGATIAPGNQLRWDAWNTVVAWCRTIMEDQPEVHGPTCTDCIHLTCAQIKRRRYPRNTVTSMVGYLSRQFRLIIREEWAPVMFGEFLDLERRLSRFVDRPADRWYAGKCSATDESGNHCTAELYATVDRGFIYCPACEQRHDVAERREFLLDEAKGILVTATEAAGALMAWTDYDGSETKLVDRIRKWRDRERLDVADVTSLHGRDRHLYRLGDIQALMVDDAQRRQKRHIDGAA